MKSLEEVIIVKYASKIRDIQKNQIEPYEHLIHRELARLIPSLVKKNADGVHDWTCDIMNCDSDAEVLETIRRIQHIEREQVECEQTENLWTCKYCGKNTSEVEYDYLFGTDHVSCVLENDHADESPLNNVEQLQNQMSRMQDYITQLESRLLQLETQYEEPTN